MRGEKIIKLLDERFPQHKKANEIPKQSGRAEVVAIWLLLGSAPTKACDGHGLSTGCRQDSGGGAALACESEEEWLHDINDAWRAQLCTIVSRERPQHCANAQRTLFLQDALVRQ